MHIKASDNGREKLVLDITFDDPEDKADFQKRFGKMLNDIQEDRGIKAITPDDNWVKEYGVETINTSDQEGINAMLDSMGVPEQLRESIKEGLIDAINSIQSMAERVVKPSDLNMKFGN